MNEATFSSRVGEAQFAREEPLAERLTHMLIAVAAELAVTHERVDTLERLLRDAGVIEPGSIDEFVPDDEAESARREWREHFLDKLFEHLGAEIAAAKDSTAADRDG